MVSRRTRVACWIRRRHHPIVPELRFAAFSLRSRHLPYRGRLLTPPLLSSWTIACMAGFQVILHGCFRVFTEAKADLDLFLKQIGQAFPPHLSTFLPRRL